MDVILLSISPFLSIKDIQKTCRALNVNKPLEVDMFKRYCLEQLSLTDSEKRAIMEIQSLPPLNLNAGLFLKIYKPNLLRRMIVQNELLDPRTKVQLLSDNYPRLFDWFIDTFIERKPFLCKICLSDLRLIFEIVSQEYNRQLRLDNILFVCVGSNAIRCYDVETNQVIAFAVGDTLYYLHDKTIPYFKNTFMFKTVYSIYKYGENRTLENFL